MKISNVTTDTAINDLKKVSNSIAKNTEKLSSGKEINSFSDNAANASQVVSLKNSENTLHQVSRNLNQGISYAQVAEGGLNEISNILIRLKEISAQGANETVSDSDRNLMESEVVQLKEEMSRISENTKYNNESLLNGTGKVVSMLAGESTDASNFINLDLSKINASTSKLGVSGLSVASQSDAESSMQSIDDALSVLAEQRGSLSAVSSRVQFALENNATQSVNTSAARSKIEDLDYAKEIAEYTANTVKSQATTSILSQMNFNKSSVLKLL